MSGPAEKPARFQFSLKTAIILTVIAGGILGLVFAGRSAMNNIMEPEYRLHATCLTFSIVDQFIKDHPGRWPKSWEELQTVKECSVGIYSWPRDSGEIQKRVKIDFNASLEDLAQQDGHDFKVAEDFNPIQPAGAYYAVYSSEVIHLLATIRMDVELRSGKKKQAVPSPTDIRRARTDDAAAVVLLSQFRFVTEWDAFKRGMPGPDYSSWNALVKVQGKDQIEQSAQGLEELLRDWIVNSEFASKEDRNTVSLGIVNCELSYRFSADQMDKAYQKFLAAYKP